MKLIPITAVLASALVISACTEQNESESSSSVVEEKSASTSPKDVPQQVKVNHSSHTEIAKGDPSTPDSAYTELVDGSQLMFMFYGLSKLPTDYNKLADTYIKDYRYNQDEFAKRDILEAAKPEMDAEITRAKQHRYWKFRASDSVRLSPYDFENKSFRQNAISPNTYFNFRHNNYELTFTNAKDFESVPVIDEAKAREIAKIRNKSRAITMDVYLYAQGADLSRNAVKAQIMKMVIKTKNGEEIVI